MNAKKMAKHFELEIADGVFTAHRRTAAIAAEAALDGLGPGPSGSENRRERQGRNHAYQQ